MMYNNGYMYAIERSDEYLAHYGVRGMKWGVRKAIASGNSQKLSKQYAKASKKLAKLEKQAGKSKKYARRAALMGAGAAAAGGLAAIGTKGVADAMDSIHRGTRGLGKAMTNVRGNNRIARTIRNSGASLDRLNKITRKEGAMTKNLGSTAATAVRNWGNSNSIASGVANAGIGHLRRTGGTLAERKMATRLVSNGTVGKVKGITNNTIARVGAGVVGAGLAAGAARNAYKAATAQKKAARFKSEMNKAFAGTQYANGGNKASSGSKPRQGKKRRR